jgi:tRNA1(Val) A37 N6-methylase TrmN6
MSIKKSVYSKLIKNFQLRDLFNQLGWNHTTKKESVAVDGQVYQLEAIAEKSAFFVFVCETAGKVPDYAFRKKIDTTITKLYHQHLIIYTDSSKRQQVWQLVVKELDKPAVVRESTYYSTAEPELLFQKLQHLFFSIDEEDNITVVDVAGRVQAGFNTNAEKVTKKFYEGFKKEHTAFLGFIKGISELQDKDWYASLMLNRLMFIYFIQKKGFLNSDRNYLRTKLDDTQTRKGKDKFYSFYRNFLLVLFHQGLGSPDNKKLEGELGKVPYLNGGLFDVHELETTYTAIQIEDKAFERIFDFFDQYEWHLDTRQQATGKEINPDVIGYIFEKYINDRATMGAYYTKEDITDYIGKNSIIPFLFDELKRDYPAALNKGSDVWKLLQLHPTNYIYSAMQHGVELELPAEIAKGLDNISKRGEWNNQALREYALQTEIWREVIERRRRYAEVKCKIETDEIHDINDLITYNLNITKFAIDVIQNSSDPELIRHFYEAVEKITILDPTCGSGAFLFAAMNILEPLYEACIARMHAFVAESTVGKYKAFEDILKRVDAPEHPNLQYFIFKTIILNNLFGVDIMKEAIEIAKLRLFLKLVATVDVDYKKPNMGLEPLPDIDFNIRSGNSLVGFVSIDEVKKSVTGSFDAIYMEKEIASIEEAAEYVKRAYDSFREVQMAGDATVKEFKKVLTNKLAKLNDRLDVYLAKLYSKDPKKVAAYQEWHNSHKPFHWFAEFYDIIHDRGGFDVIIGNPPYVVYPSDLPYRVNNFITISCSNLYAFCTEKSHQLINLIGRFGMIIPNSSISADKMSDLQNIVTHNKITWISNFSWRPAKLFEGANMLLAIILSASSSKDITYSTMYNKWFGEYRDNLFSCLNYNDISGRVHVGTLPKLPSYLYNSIIDKMTIKSNGSFISSHFLNKPTKYYLLYFRAVLYWIKILDKEPVFLENGKQTVTGEMKPVYFNSKQEQYAFTSILSSSLFFVHYITWSSCQVINSRDFKMPFNYKVLPESISLKLEELGKKLQLDYQSNSKLMVRNYSKKSREFTMEKQYFYIKRSKAIIDEIDKVLSEFYGFSKEEYDFIINYDIKYRMGLTGVDDEDVE